MASEKKLVKKLNFIFLQKLAAGVSLLALTVIIAAGVMGGARTVTITYRAAVVIVVIGVIARVLIKILASYEELNSGKG